jgi:hypothetical protein
MPTDAPPVINLETPWLDPRDGSNLTHLEWAAGVAGAIAYGMGLQGEHEVAELVSVAHMILWRRVVGDECNPFDPSQVPAGGSADGQFRGWVHRSIQGECIREARRIRAGGTKNPNKSVRCLALPSFVNEAGEEEVALRRRPRGDRRAGGSGRDAEPAARREAGRVLAGVSVREPRQVADARAARVRPVRLAAVRRPRRLTI